MEQNLQNKRRRRSSITQQLHRIFNVDRQEIQKQQESWHVPSNASARAAPDQHWQYKEKGTDKQLYHNDQYNDQSSHHPTKGSPDLSDMSFVQACCAASGEPLLRPSRQKSPEGLKNAVEKVQGFSGTPENASRSIEGYTALNGTNSVSPKKDKRVTRRLEAERIELEKRLLKLEQTQLAGNHNSLKRESRRLTKKQPLGSSSRGSSVSADESRPSSRRLSALFSISRRTSISRSSSANGRNGEESTDSAPVPTEIPADDVSTLQVARPSLSTSLPERFSAVISKGLIDGSNALLQDQTPPAQSPSSPATATATNEECSLQKPGPTLDSAKQQINDHGKSSKPRSLHTSPDLDRISFAATLHLARRARASDQLQGRSPGTVQHPSLVQRDITQNGKVYDSQNLGSSKIRAVPQQTSSAVDNPSSLPANFSVKSIPRRTFKPSPLAGDSISGGSSQSLAGNASALRLRNSGVSHGARRTPSSPLVTVATSMSPAVGTLQTLQPSTNNQSETEREGKPVDGASESTSKSNDFANARVFKEQKPLDYVSSQQPRTRHLNQSSAPVSKPPQLSVKARIHASTGGKNVNVNHPSLKHIRHEEAPTVHGPRRARVNQDIPHLPEHESPRRRDDQQFATPGSASSRSSSPEPCSEDYDTADETASIGAVPRGNDDCLHSKSAAASGACSGQKTVESNDSTRESKFSDAAVFKVGNPQGDRSATETGACQRNQSIAKTFVICCSCKYWHNMPPESYSKVASPDTYPVPARNGSTLLGRGSSFADRNASRKSSRSTQIKSALLSKRSANEKVTLGRQTRPQYADAPLQCCWCDHPMSRLCCEGWTTTVYKHERQF